MASHLFVTSFVVDRYESVYVHLKLCILERIGFFHSFCSRICTVFIGKLVSLLVFSSPWINNLWYLPYLYYGLRIALEAALLIDVQIR